MGNVGWRWVGEILTFAKKNLFLLVLLSLSFSAFSQSVDNSGAGVVSNESEISLNIVDENTNPEAELSVGGGKKQSSVWPFIKMFLILAVLVAAIYGVLYFVKRNMNKTVDEDEFLRRVAFLNLAPGKSVEVVTLIDHAYLVGVSDAGINLISEINDKELIEAMNLNADRNRNVTKPRNFADVLNIFMPGGQGTNIKNENIFEGSEQTVSAALKNQRSKLNNNGEGGNA